MRTIKFLFLAIFLLASSVAKLSATDYYWIGGGGTWEISHFSSTSGGGQDMTQLPTINDNVYFNANSGFTTISRNVSMPTGGAACKDLIFDGCTVVPYLNVNNGLTINGSLQLQAGMTIAYSYGGPINFTSPNAGETIQWSGVEISSPVNFNGNGSWTFLDNFNQGYYGSNIIVNNNGMLILDNITVKNNSITVNNSAQISIKNTIINVSTWTYNSSVVLSGTASANSTINVHGNSSNNIFSTVHATDKYYNLNMVSEGSGHHINRGTFNKITYAAGSGFLANGGTIVTDSLLLHAFGPYQFNNNVTVNKYLLAKSAVCGGLIDLKTNNYTTQRTLTYGGTPADIKLENVRISNIAITGSGTPYPVTNGSDYGGNSGWNFLPGSGHTWYWVGGTGNWTDKNHWADESGGTPGSGCIPTPLDNVIFDNG
ncbi:hypothetical protein AGMMS50262_15690 [Bacteroidia bacterium]|nr:hypothetical protein AGMMS50262_15690 [Bacteroidia bacterium]